MFRPIEGGQRSETVRRANLSAIVRELHVHGPLSRSELGARTGLTRSAIRRLIGELGLAGLVTETPAGPSGVPGRPSPVVRAEARSAVALAFEISVDTLAVATVGLGGTVLARERIDRPPDHAAPEAIVADLVALAERQRSGWTTSSRVVGLGVAVVGVVRREDGLVSIAPNLGWRDVPLGAIVADAFGGDGIVSVANDADLAALAEHRRGAAVGEDDVVVLVGEIGVGGGVIVGGRAMTGAAGYGGEVGHLPINPVAGIGCRCGAVGCWETEISEATLLVRAGEPPDAGRAGLERVIARAAAGDRVAQAAIDELGRWLGVGIAGLVNVLNPSLVVLGGRFARLHPLVSAMVDAELGRRALAAPRGLVRIVPGSLGMDAALLGAAELALEPILADPAGWFHRIPGRPALATA